MNRKTEMPNSSSLFLSGVRAQGSPACRSEMFTLLPSKGGGFSKYRIQRGAISANRPEGRVKKRTRRTQRPETARRTQTSCTKAAEEARAPNNCRCQSPDDSEVQNSNASKDSESECVHSALLSVMADLSLLHFFGGNPAVHQLPKCGYKPLTGQLVCPAHYKVPNQTRAR